MLPTRLTWSTAMLAAVVAAGVLARLALLTWDDPWGPHHPDETVLALEAVALWEGVTPREIGWPASTTRVALGVVAAADWALDEGVTVWRQRANPAVALQTISDWIGSRFVDQSSLYVLGRWTALVIGVLQLVAMVWALRRWVGAAGTVAGTAVVALGSLPVAFSQWVLADMTGVLFATVVVGLAASPTPSTILWMAVCAGLAAASKFHFGLWLLTPVLCIWLRLGMTTSARWRLTLGSVALFTVVVVFWVPWLWIDPVLAMKEFAGVVFVKVGSGATVADAGVHVLTLLGSLGAIAWIGALLGVTTLTRRRLRDCAPVVVPIVVGVAGLSASAIVFDRYALVVLPAVAVLAAMGWERGLLEPRGPVRLAITGVFAISVVWAGATLVRSQREIGQTHVDVLVRRWILERVPSGSTVALYDETVAPLPRTADQLRACAERPESAEGYRDKWRVLGIDPPIGVSEPMRAMLLNDERFHAYWCRRELGVRLAHPAGYRVVSFHADPRFWAIREADAIDRFRAEASGTGTGLDALVLNRLADVGVAPAAVLRSAGGERVIYVRPGFRSLAAGEESESRD
jgi:hypothetical protein